MLNRLCQGLLATIFLLLVACSQEIKLEKENTENRPKVGQTLPEANLSKVSSEEELTLESFPDFPEDIDGCSCYFSRNEKEFNEQKYIYMNDFANISFISINGSLRKLELKKHEEKPISYFIYADSDYELRIETKTKKATDDELDRVTGKITVRNLKNQKVTKSDFI